MSIPAPSHHKIYFFARNGDFTSNLKWLGRLRQEDHLGLGAWKLSRKDPVSREKESNSCFWVKKSQTSSWFFSVLFLFFFFHLFIYCFCMCLWVPIHVTARVQRLELFLSFLHVGSEDWTHILWLGDKCLFPLGHLISPLVLFFQVSFCACSRIVFIEKLHNHKFWGQYVDSQSCVVRPISKQMNKQIK